MRSSPCEAMSKDPSLTAGGVHQWSRSNGSPFLKNMENWPPSGPSQKRSSPPKALMCGLFTPEARSSRLIQPKLRPFGPPAVLVITRPWRSGLTATWASPSAVLRTTTFVWVLRKARSSLNRIPSGALADFAQPAAMAMITNAAPMPIPYLMRPPSVLSVPSLFTKRRQDSSRRYREEGQSPMEGKPVHMGEWAVLLIYTAGRRPMLVA
jgi:hypothetical protein